MQSAITRFVSSARREEGAITVVGLFMACFLTGAVWYVVGIASAVLYCVLDGVPIVWRGYLRSPKSKCTCRHGRSDRQDRRHQDADRPP